jgi:hypothetical protein
MIAFIMIASLGVNMFTINRLWTISQNYLDLRKEYAVLVEEKRKVPKAEKVTQAAPPPTPVVQDFPKIEEATPPPVKKKKKDKGKKEPQPPSSVPDTSDRYKKLQEDFEKIKKREEKDAA